jgi:hypothetical protein
MAVPKKKKVTPHQEDVFETRKLLQSARVLGQVGILKTVDGDIYITHRPGTKRFAYDVRQVFNGEEVAAYRADKTELQAYLIGLREERRKQDREKRKQEKEQRG